MLKLRTAGKIDEALAEFEKAYAIDPASSIAEQEIRRTRAIIEREKKKALGPEGESKPEERAVYVKEERVVRVERVGVMHGGRTMKALRNQSGYGCSRRMRSLHRLQAITWYLVQPELLCTGAFWDLWQRGKRHHHWSQSVESG